MQIVTSRTNVLVGFFTGRKLCESCPYITGARGTQYFKAVDRPLTGTYGGLFTSKAHNYNYVVIIVDR